MRFRAKVMDGQLQVQMLTLDAGDEAEARHVIGNAGLRVLALQRAGMALPKLAGGGSFQLAVFNQQLHSLLAAGQTVSEAVDILSCNDRSGRHRDVYRTLLEELRRGKQFSDAMAGLPSIFPPLYVAMVRASETTGAVQLSVRRFMLYQRQVDDIRKKLSSAAIYPAILIVVGFAVVAFLMLYVVPRFSVVFDGTTTQNGGSGAFIRSWGGFVRENTLLAWLGFASIAGVGLAAIVHPMGRARAAQQLAQLPWIGERLHIFQLARLYRTLSLLLRSGVTLVAAMRMTQASLPLAMQLAVGRVTQAVSEGRSLSLVMTEQGLATEVAQRLLVAGESSGDLENMLDHIADFYDQEVSIWIDAASRLIEPMLMVGIGLVIGAIVLMLYMPIFDMANVT